MMEPRERQSGALAGRHRPRHQRRRRTALAYAARHPMVDLQAVVTVSGDTLVRGRLGVEPAPRGGSRRRRGDGRAPWLRRAGLVGTRGAPGCRRAGSPRRCRSTTGIRVVLAHRGTVATIGMLSNIAELVTRGHAAPRKQARGNGRALSADRPEAAAGPQPSPPICGLPASLMAGIPWCSCPSTSPSGPGCTPAILERLRGGDSLCVLLAGLLDAFVPRTGPCDGRRSSRPPARSTGHRLRRRRLVRGHRAPAGDRGTSRRHRAHVHRPRRRRRGRRRGPGRAQKRSPSTGWTSCCKDRPNGRHVGRHVARPVGHRAGRPSSPDGSEVGRAHGPDVVPAWVAEMDFPPAPCVRAAVAACLDRGDLGYPPFQAASGVPRAFAERAEALGAGASTRPWSTCCRT